MAASGKRMQVRSLDSREYKLLLRPEDFTGDAMVQQANRLWDDDVVPVIGALDRTASDDPRHDGRFELAARRPIQYRDTAEHDLERLDLSLRLRGSKPAEWTLKYRMPDLFVVADAADRHASDEPSLEEDIAPLEVQRGPGDVAVPMSPSMRSRFAWSEHRSPPNRMPETVSQLAGFFPLVKTRLKQDPSEGAALAPLLGGPEFDEYILRGPSVDLGRDTRGKFVFTLWFSKGETDRARVAELSWRCRLDKSSMPGQSAMRAYQMFLRLQQQLGTRLDDKNSSKTKLALP